MLADTVAIVLRSTMKAMNPPNNLINRFSSSGTLVVMGSCAFEAIKATWNNPKLENGNVTLPSRKRVILKKL
jgi:hypothetical protein